MFFAEHDPTSKRSFFFASSTTSAVTRLRNQGLSRWIEVYPSL
jgi:hypothetical protein